LEDRLKELYELELRHLESHVADFTATEKLRQIAGRLGLSEGEQVRDPFVEWLLQGAAFLAARVQQTIEDEFPRFSGAMLDIVFPHLAAPTPSMMVVQFGFSGTVSAGMLEGPVVEKGMELGMPVHLSAQQDRRKGLPDAVFVTGRSVTLWPAHVSEAEYLPDPATVSTATGGSARGASGVRVTLTLDCEGSFKDMGRDTLDLHFSEAGIAPHLMEALAFGRCRAGVVQGAERKRGTRVFAPITIEPLGFDREIAVEGGREAGKGTEEDILLPYDRRSFDGYRLLHEYFALPERFHFVRLSGLRAALQGVQSGTATLVFIFDGPCEVLAGRVDASGLRINCVPAINLFPVSADSLTLDPRLPEHEISPNRDQPTAYEVHSFRNVSGRLNKGGEVRIRPFFSTAALGGDRQGSGSPGTDGQIYYIMHRRPRSRARTLKGDEEAFAQAKYRGSDAFLSIVDANETPISKDERSAFHALRSLDIDALCTNRFLPMLRRSGDVDLKIRGKCSASLARIIGRPSEPRSGTSQGRAKWDVVSHLSLNHLSLVETESGTPAQALRQMLRLYASSQGRMMIDGLKAVKATPVVGRAPNAHQIDGRPLPVVFTRGMEVAVTFDPSIAAAPVLAAILDRFFAGYAPVSAFTRTVLTDENDRERVRWPARAGLKKVL